MQQIGLVSNALADQALLEKVRSSVARDIAFSVEDIETILDRYSVTSKLYNSWVNDPSFNELVVGYKIELSTAEGREERETLEYKIMYRQLMLEAYARAHDRKEPLSSVVSVAEQARKAGKIGTGADGPTGPSVSIKIDLGNDRTLEFKKTIEGELVDPPPDPEQGPADYAAIFEEPPLPEIA